VSCTHGTRLTDTLVGVTADYKGIAIYFPELYLAQWFEEKRNGVMHRFDQSNIDNFNFKRTMAPDKPQPRGEGVSLSGAMPEQNGRLHHGKSPAYPHDTGRVCSQRALCEQANAFELRRKR
jgi:hypothetical protein